MVASIRRFDIFLVALDPTKGSEMQKTRPCLVISPDVMNQLLNCVIVAPLTSTIRKYPFRMDISFKRKKGQIGLDHMRSVDRSRLFKKVGSLDEAKSREISGILTDLFMYE